MIHAFTRRDRHGGWIWCVCIEAETIAKGHAPAQLEARQRAREAKELFSVSSKKVLTAPLTVPEYGS